MCESGRWIDALKKRGRVLKKRGRVLKKRGRVLKNNATHKLKGGKDAVLERLQDRLLALAHKISALLSLQDTV